MSVSCRLLSSNLGMWCRDHWVKTQRERGRHTVRLLKRSNVILTLGKPCYSISGVLRGLLRGLRRITAQMGGGSGDLGLRRGGRLWRGGYRRGDSLGACLRGYRCSPRGTCQCMSALDPKAKSGQTQNIHGLLTVTGVMLSVAVDVMDDVIVTAVCSRSASPQISKQ